MSTVKNYDAENFTSSEIEIKSGQNYDIKFKNARADQISWNVEGNDIVVTVKEPQLNQNYKTFEYFKKVYTEKTLATQVLEKTEVTADSNPLVTKHSYLLVTQNATDGYDLKVMEQTREQDANGVWADELSEAVQKAGTTTIHVADLDGLQGDTTYGEYFAGVNEIAEVLGEEHVTVFEDDTTVSVYTTTISRATAKGSDDNWNFTQVSSITKSQPETPVTASETYATVKYTQAWTGSSWSLLTPVANGSADVVQADLATVTLEANKYTYSTTIAQYAGSDYGTPVSSADFESATALTDANKTTYFKKTYDYLGQLSETSAESANAFNTFADSTADFVPTATGYAKQYTGDPAKLVLKNAATFGDDHTTDIGLTATDKGGNVIIGYPDGDEVEPHDLKENYYTITGVPDKETTPTKYTFTGTSLNENAESTAKDDTFNLGTGYNTINIDVTSDFGKDTVIGTEDEGLTVNLNGFTSDYAIDSSVSENGKDVILTVTKGTGEDLTTQGSITIQDYNVKNVFGDGFITVNTVNGLDIEEYEGIFADASITGVPDSSTNPTKYTFTGTWRSETATTTALNDTINLGTGDDRITVKALNNGNDTVIANKDESLVLNYDKEGILNTSASNIAKIEVKGSDVVATTKAEYYATMTITKSATKTEGEGENAVTYATMDGQKITGYDFNTPENGKVEVKFVLAKYGAPDQNMKNKMLWRSENPFYKTAAYPDGVYLFLDSTNLASDETAELFGGILLDNTTLKVYESINGAAGVDVTDAYKTKYTDPATFSTFNEKLLSAATESTVTVKNALTSGAFVTIDGKAVTASIDPHTGEIALSDDVKEQLKAANTLFEAEDVVAKSKKGKLDLSKVSNDKVISLTGLTSENGKGANIITKAGNDEIYGSDFNDTLNLKAGNNEITESAGVNKITTGKGNDKITIDGLASATIKTSGGNNLVSLDGIGVNKFTGGNGTDTVRLFGATNTVKAGKKGVLDVTINGGNNNITGGKKADDIRITAMGAGDSVNKINAGAGDDYIIADSGYNTITLGKGNDDIVINDGINVVKGTAGNNTYTIAGGKNVITGGKNVDEFIFSGDDSISFVNGGKGNDIYDLSAYGYGGSVSIKDTSGKNVVKLAEKDTILFDVTLGKNDKKDKVGKVFTFDNDGDNTTTDDTVTFNGSIKKVTVGNTDYTLNVKGVAEQVASFMRSIECQKGDSAYDVLAKGGENAAKLLAIYQGNEVTVGEKTFSAQMYK